MWDFGEIPWLGVLVAVVASQVIGFLWYGPLFVKPWLAALGKTEEEMKAGGSVGPAVAIGVVCSIVAAIALALVISITDDPDMMTGAKIGLLAAIGFVVSYIVLTSVYEQRNSTLAWIASGNQIVTLTVMGAILGAMW